MKPLCGCWELNLLQVQRVLTIELSLQLPSFLFTLKLAHVHMHPHACAHTHVPTYLNTIHKKTEKQTLGFYLVELLWPSALDQMTSADPVSATYDLSADSLPVSPSAGHCPLVECPLYGSFLKSCLYLFPGLTF